MRIRPWSFAILLITLCVLVVGAFEWRRRSRDFSDKALFQRLPPGPGLNVYLNVQALRQAGFLDMIAGSKSAEETEYRDFVKSIGFDYRADLDTVVGWLGRESTNLFLLKGRFSWEQIGGYLKRNGAKCLNGFCSVETRRGKFISVMPLSEQVLAVGIGHNTGVAYEALQVRERKDFDPPDQPIWLGVSRAYLDDPSGLPESARAFASAVKDAENVFLGVQAAQGGIEACLRADFRTQEQAGQTRAQLEDLTGVLKKLLTRDAKPPGPLDLGGTLTNGSFQQEQRRVFGRWPLRRELLEQIAGDM